MFVLLVIPVVGGLLAGRLLASRRAAHVATGALAVLTAVLLVGLRIAEMRNYAGAKLNLNMWIAVACCAVLGYGAAEAGRRLRTGTAGTPVA